MTSGPSITEPTREAAAAPAAVVAPVVGPRPLPAAEEAERQERLDRMKRRATGLLALAVVIFFVAASLERHWPWMAFVRATAEAAMVGGLADWFAVTALFRRPLGLPIPHTAIVATRKDRIGRTLGNFVQNHFLSRDVVATKLHALGAAARAARWIAEPDNAHRLARQFAAGLARAVDTLPPEQARSIIRHTLITRIEKTAVAPVLGNALSMVVADDRHQEILNGALTLVGQVVEENRDLIRERIATESPWWVPGIVDEKIYLKIMAAIERLLEDVRADPTHPLRAKFDTMLADFIDRLKHSPEMMARADALKSELLRQPFVDEVASALWDSLRRGAARYAERPDEAPPDSLERGITAFGDSLQHNEAMLQQIDDALSDLALSVVEQYRHEVADLIADTIARWDPELTSRRIELAIGRDLQFIRINGTLVGGLAGLAIYLVRLLMR